jgi:diketogulonate reductase-like aldo/keto reductase
MGYRHLDTAMAYENEAAVGRAIAQSDVDREDIFLATKIKGYPEFLEYDRLLRAAEGCLERLDTDTIDLLLIHWWNPVADMERTVAAVDRLVDEGKVEHIGVINCSVPQLRRAMNVSDSPIVTNQIEHHPYWDNSDIVQFCQQQNIIVTAYSPLAEGRVVGDETMQAIGERHGKTPAQVAIRWLIQQENVVTIPKTITTEHMRDNIDVFDFELSAGEIAAIDELDGPFWYRTNREGGYGYRFRNLVSPLVPNAVAERLPLP